MPLIYVRRDEKIIRDDMIRALVSALPEIIADALTVPNSDGVLTRDDIEIRVSGIGPFDVSTKDLEVIIFAGDYPERKADLDQRKEKIIEGIKSLSSPGGMIETISGFVWIVLSPNSFGEFEALWD